MAIVMQPISTADAALTIEVANTSYAYDRFSKWVTYAGVGVPIYWIVGRGRRLPSSRSCPGC